MMASRVDKEKLGGQLLCALSAACLLGTASLWEAEAFKTLLLVYIGPGMPAAIFEEGAERKAQDADIHLRFAARTIKKCRRNLMHRAVVGGVLVFELSEYGLDSRLRAGKAFDNWEKTFFVQEYVPVVSLVHK